jgi:hypothetical protein
LSVSQVPHYAPAPTWHGRSPCPVSATTEELKFLEGLNTSLAEQYTSSHGSMRAVAEFSASLLDTRTWRDCSGPQGPSPTPSRESCGPVTVPLSLPVMGVCPHACPTPPRWQDRSPLGTSRRHRPGSHRPGEHRPSPGQVHREAWYAPLSLWLQVEVAHAPFAPVVVVETVGRVPTPTPSPFFPPAPPPFHASSPKPHQPNKSEICTSYSAVVPH